jgi:lipopolysaccharide/colanic/teichoic acid biosynthesis glycosyltransferase
MRRAGGSDFRRVQPFVERVAAAVALVSIAPVVLVLGAILVISSGFPVFFFQARVGRGGKTFRLVKLRSMRPGKPGPSITASGDPRIFPLGALLRRYKLDELPQLWNIVRGEMQFVGPRPELPKYVDPEDPRWQAVLRERPGLTDLSTLVYRHEEEFLAKCPDPERAYSEVLLPRKLELSAAYGRIRNPFADLKLILLTARYSFLPRGFDPKRILAIFLEQT